MRGLFLPPPPIVLEVTAYLEAVSIEVRSAVAVNLRRGGEGGEVTHTTSVDARARGEGASGAAIFDQIFVTPPPEPSPRKGSRRSTAAV